MRFNRQLIKHDPENGNFGDCHRTAYSCILDLHPTQVPNFGIHYNDPQKFADAEQEFLESIEFTGHTSAYSSTLEEVLEMQGVHCRGVYILGGLSKSGVNHSVIGHGGALIWDPSPDNVGIVGPCTDGLYWITTFAPWHYGSNALDKLADLRWKL